MILCYVWRGQKKLPITKLGAEDLVSLVNKTRHQVVLTAINYNTHVTPHQSKESHKMNHAFGINCKSEHARRPNLWHPQENN